jgi:hypothetical protein
MSEEDRVRLDAVFSDSIPAPKSAADLGIAQIGLPAVPFS